MSPSSRTRRSNSTDATAAPCASSTPRDHSSPRTPASTAPRRSWYKPDARSSFELPDFSLSTEKHRLDGLALAAIGDDGQGHKALYWGESVTPVKPGEVFATIADDTWRRYVPECWLTSANGTEKVSSVTARVTSRLYISGPRRRPRASRAARAEREPCRTDRTRTRWEHISANDVISVYREGV